MYVLDSSCEQLINAQKQQCGDPPAEGECGSWVGRKERTQKQAFHKKRNIVLLLQTGGIIRGQNSIPAKHFFFRRLTGSTAPRTRVSARSWSRRESS